jgi:hypothetical protein
MITSNLKKRGDYMGIKLEFHGMKEGGKQEPLVGTSFLLYSTNQTFGELKLEKLLKGLRLWRMVIPIGEVEFTEAQEVDDKTIFGLTMKYQDLVPITEEQLTDTFKSIYANFSLFLDQRVEDLDK